MKQTTGNQTAHHLEGLPELFSQPGITKKILITTSFSSKEHSGSWLSSRVLDLRSMDRWFEPRRRHYVVSLGKTAYPLLSTGSTQKMSRHDRTF